MWNNKLILYGSWATKELSNNEHRFARRDVKTRKRKINGGIMAERKKTSLTVFNWNKIVNSIYWIHFAAASNWYQIKKYWNKFTRFMQYSASLLFPAASRSSPSSLSLSVDYFQFDFIDAQLWKTLHCVQLN